MTKKQIQETLCKLYLRLNGYLVCNLIIHSSEQGNSDSELDIIAVRFPHHKQIDRRVDSSDFLELNNSSTEILIAEIKSGNQDLEFNKGLRRNKDSISKLLSWIGIFNENEFKNEIEEIETIMNSIHKDKSNSFIIKDYNLKGGLFRLRFTFFAVDKGVSQSGSQKYIHGQELIDYCWSCLKTTNTIETCSRKYNYEGWGEYEKLVRYFKERTADQGTIDDLYKTKLN